jgi:hypothetical protein
MLGRVMGHPDEKALLHAMLLPAPLQQSLRMVSPALHVFNPTTGHFEETTVANLALGPGGATGVACLGVALPRCHVRCARNYTLQGPRWSTDHCWSFSLAIWAYVRVTEFWHKLGMVQTCAW